MPEASQKMNMVSDPVRDETKATLAANGATQVFPEPRSQLGLKPGFAVFGGKNDVIEKAGIRLRHDCVLLLVRHPCGVVKGCGDCYPRVTLRRRGASASPWAKNSPPPSGLYTSHVVSNR